MRARGIGARSPVRLELDVLRDATALTASEDLEEPFMTLSTRRLCDMESALNAGGSLPAATSSLRGGYDHFTGAAAPVDQTVPRRV